MVKSNIDLIVKVEYALYLSNVATSMIEFDSYEVASAVIYEQMKWLKDILKIMSDEQGR